MRFTHDLIVLGAGAAGLTAAGGAAMFGLKVALIERGAMGGECLNTGCVPSKALIAAAARAQAGRGEARLGIGLGAPQIDWAGVRAHVDGAIAAIAPHDSEERFEGMGVEVIREAARFTGRDRVAVEGRTLRAPRIVIATGSRPKVPPIDGLDTVPYLTNETLFALEELPRRLLILGGGPVGIEMAQAFRRLGSEVAVITRSRPLGRDDRDAADLVLGQLAAEGVACVTGAEAQRIVRSEAGVRVTLGDGKELDGSHLLVALGRQPDLAGLDLAAAGVRHGEDGIEVDARRRTSNRRIYAIGDCRAGPRFTHAAGYEGSLVVLQVALGLPSKVEWAALPHVTYCNPELAQIGLTEAEARERHGKAITVIREEFADNDRAVAEGDTRGFLNLVMRGRKVLGVTIVGAHAGEVLLSWWPIVTGRKSSLALASAIVAYPTRSEIAKAAAFSAWEPAVFGAWPRRWAGLLAKSRRWLG